MSSIASWLKRLAAALTFTLPCLAHAAAYPSHKVYIVVPYTAGGGVDATARVMAEALTTYFKQPFIVENRPGPGGTIGASYVAHAAADGYTLLVGGDGSLSLAPFFMKDLPYNAKRDLQPISLLVTIPQILVVKSGKFANFQAFLDQGRHGHVTIAGTQSSGQELAVLMLKERTGANIQFIPYKGTSNEVSDLLGGVVDAAFADPSVTGLLHAGTLKALAVTTPKQSPANPGIPTLEEVGVKDAAYPGFYSLNTASGVSPTVIAILNAGVKHVLADPEVRKRLMAQGLDPHYTTPAEANAFVDNQVARASALLKAAQVTH